MDLAGLRRLARSQRGLFTRAQAGGCGASPSQIRRRLASGEWQPVLGKVLAPADLVLTPLVLDHAAALAVPGGVLAGPSAARMWGVTVPDSRTYLAVGRDRHPRVSGIRYLRFEVPRRELSRCDGAAVTTLRRAVLDCLTLLPEGSAQELLDRALGQGWVSVDHLVAYLQLNPNRPGLRQVRRLLRRVSGGARFEAERRLAALLSGAGIKGWAANAPIHDARGLIGVGDVVFQAARLVLEVDGWAFHVTSGQFQRDRHRQNRLVAAGWRVVRFTWLDLTERPEYVIATVRSLLAS